MNRTPIVKIVVNRYQVINKNKAKGMSENDSVDVSWHQTSQGKDLISSLRQPFGIFEKPLAIQNTNYDILEYKLLLYGKSGVGKSSLVSKLLGCPIQPNYYETPGIEISTINWPIKIMSNGLVTIFRLNLWDVGDNALVRYSHFNSLCRENLDGIIFVFSFTDKSSFVDVTKKVVLEESGLCKFIVGCKLDSLENEVTLKEVKEFGEFWRNKIFSSSLQTPGVEEVPEILNEICSQLLKQNKKPSNVQSQRS